MKDNATISKEYTEWNIKNGGMVTAMTLRDYWAGLAMQSLIVVYKDDKQIVGEYSERAYQIADAMLKERAK
jgi:hypothetical protein